MKSRDSTIPYVVTASTLIPIPFLLVLLSACTQLQTGGEATSGGQGPAELEGRSGSVSKVPDAADSGALNAPIDIVVNEKKVQVSSFKYAKDAIEWVESASASEVAEPGELPFSENEIVTFTISPELPEGLIFDSATGKIGVKSSHPFPPMEFKVTASNEDGSKVSSATVKLALYGMKLSSSGYSIYTQLPCFQGDYFSAGLPNFGATQFKVSPDLPAGLKLDPASGTISGASEIVLPKTQFTITASNVGNELKIPLVLEFLPKDEKFTYFSKSFVFFSTGPRSLKPEFVPQLAFAKFSISPVLPDGLSIDSSTGLISGANLKVFPQSEFTVTIKGETANGQLKSVSTLVKLEGKLSSSIFGSLEGKQTLYGTLSRIPSTQKFVFAGGMGDSFSATKSVSLLDPVNRKLSVAASMNIARAHHGAISLNSSKLILVAGGVDAGGVGLNSIEIYDPLNDSWTLLDVALKVPRDPELYLVSEKPDEVVVLVTGGAKVTPGYEVLHLFPNELSKSYISIPEGAISFPSFHATAGGSLKSSGDLRLMDAGGLSLVTFKEGVAGFKSYNGNYGLFWKWAPNLEMPAPIYNPADGRVLVGVQDQMQLFDLASETWVGKPVQVPVAAERASSTLDGSVYYFFGGRTQIAPYVYFKDVLRFKWVNDGVSVPEKLPMGMEFGRRGFSVAPFMDSDGIKKFLIVGGALEGAPAALRYGVEIYSP